MRRQVPSYLLVGNGRLAKHIPRMLEASALPSRVSIAHWSRRTHSKKDFCHLAANKVVLMAITDAAIIPFYREFFDESDALAWVHFSGTVVQKGCFAFHPLMTFGPQELSRQQYSRILFTGPHPEQEFRRLFPQFDNPYAFMGEDQRGLYHALCVLGCAGMQTYLLELQNQFEKLDVNQDALHLYFQTCFEAFLRHGKASVTGPWARDDTATVRLNKDALTDRSELLALYNQLQLAWEKNNES